MIVVYEQDGKDRAAYGERTLKELFRRLVSEVGRGYSVTNLQLMRRFYLTYQKQQTVSVELTWSHYIDLMNIEDDMRRSFYEHEAVNSGWTVRELR